MDTSINIAPLLQEQDQEPLLKVDEEPKGLADFLSSPKTILMFSAIYLTAYITFIGKEGGFTSQFLHFGPGTNASNTTTFVGIVLDTWQKVILMYFVSFLSSIMNTYYLYAMTNNLHSYIPYHMLLHLSLY